MFWLFRNFHWVQNTTPFPLFFSEGLVGLLDTAMRAALVGAYAGTGDRGRALAAYQALREAALPVNQGSFFDMLSPAFPLGPLRLTGPFCTLKTEQYFIFFCFPPNIHIVTSSTS